MPHSYPIPSDGPVGDMLRATKRNIYRPAHIHFRVSAPGHRELITELYTRGDLFIDLDPVLGVKDALLVDYVKDESGFRLGHDFTLQATV
jgi:protocatechuate 3,4-dioxygenase beta subunit